MNRETLEYCLLLLLCVGLHRILPLRLRPALFFAFGLVFLFALSPNSALLLLLLTVLNHQVAQVLDRTSQRMLYYGALGLNLAPLILFKYLDTGHYWLLPIGISFYTFSNLSYLIDLRRGVFEPEKNFLHFAAFAFFFPKLAAGPIERGRDFLPQLRREDPALVRIQAREGIWLFIQGLIKKFIFAEAFAAAFRPIFQEPSTRTSLELFLAAIFARYFLFADFSGYTDLARGSAKLLGIELAENFRRPFASRSVAEFWQRWHMTLSQWVRDYLYFPMLGSPLAVLGNSTLVFLSFFSLGIWHGASGPFLVYGVLQGLAVVFTIRSRAIRAKLSDLWPMPSALARTLQVGLVFLFIALTTVLFFAKDLSQAGLIYGQIFSLPTWIDAPPLKLTTISLFWRALGLILLLEFWSWCLERFPLQDYFLRGPAPRRWFLYLSAFFLLVVWGLPKSAGNFVYFHF